MHLQEDNVYFNRNIQAIGSIRGNNITGAYGVHKTGMMHFDPENTVVKLCVQGMEQEMAGRPALAKQLFLEAWEKASDDREKFTAAHYVARHQDTVTARLSWDETALKHALSIESDEIKSAMPSLYLNIGKCYEDLKDFARARENYELAFSFIGFLADNEYGKMTRSGIVAALERVK